MTWQEYQDIVGRLYDQAEGIGNVYRNITKPDKITGQSRQIDVWLEIKTKEVELGILIDSKYKKSKIDVKDVEEVLALANAIGAASSIIVCSNGWTKGADKRAKFSGMSLRLYTFEQAVEFVEPDKWIVCPVCENDCIILDQEGYIENQGLILWWMAGQCRECKAAQVWCQDCGLKAIIPQNQHHLCSCGHKWEANKNGVCLTLAEAIGKY